MHPATKTANNDAEIAGVPAAGPDDDDATKNTGVPGATKNTGVTDDAAATLQEGDNPKPPPSHRK